MTLRIIKPVALDLATQASTNAQDLRPSWVNGATYQKGATVRYGSRIQEALVAHTSSSLNTPANSPATWLDIGPDNPTAMFDDQVSTPTTGATQLIVVLTPGLLSGLALVGVVGASVGVTVRDGQLGATLYSRTIELDGAVLTDWYDYFFDPFSQSGDVYLYDLPAYASAYITISITGPGLLAVSSVLVGHVYEIGQVLKGSTLGADDYSTITTDEFGTTTLKRRSSAKRTDLQVLVPRASLRKVFALLDDLRATPAVWMPSRNPDDDALTVYGIRSSFRIVVEYSAHVLCSLEIKGMT